MVVMGDSPLSSPIQVDSLWVSGAQLAVGSFDIADLFLAVGRVTIFEKAAV